MTRESLLRTGAHAILESGFIAFEADLDDTIIEIGVPRGRPLLHNWGSLQSDSRSILPALFAVMKAQAQNTVVFAAPKGMQTETPSHQTRAMTERSWPSTRVLRPWNLTTRIPIVAAPD